MRAFDIGIAGDSSIVTRAIVVDADARSTIPDAGVRIPVADVGIRRRRLRRPGRGHCGTECRCSRPKRRFRFLERKAWGPERQFAGFRNADLRLETPMLPFRKPMSASETETPPFFEGGVAIGNGKIGI
jgi:hypothetical protein